MCLYYSSKSAIATGELVPWYNVFDISVISWYTSGTIDFLAIYFMKKGINNYKMIPNMRLLGKKKSPVTGPYIKWKFLCMLPDRIVRFSHNTPTVTHYQTLGVSEALFNLSKNRYTLARPRASYNYSHIARPRVHPQREGKYYCLLQFTAMTYKLIIRDKWNWRGQNLNNKGNLLTIFMGLCIGPPIFKHIFVLSGMEPLNTSDANHSLGALRTAWKYGAPFPQLGK